MNTLHHTDTQEIPTIQPRRRVKAWHVVALAALLFGGAGVTLGIASGAQDPNGAGDVSLASDARRAALATSPEPSPSDIVTPTPQDSEEPPAAPPQPEEPETPEAPEEPEVPEEPETPENPDEVAPVINWITVPSGPIFEKNWTCTDTTGEIQANLSDNVGIVDPRVVYFLPGTGVVTHPMALAEAGHYSATIGTFPQGTVPEGEDELTITIAVVAEDAAGNWSEEFGQVTISNDNCISFG